MAEYIDREKINLFGFYDAGDYSQAMRCIKSLPTANVIERSKYEELRLVNLDLAETNKGLLAEHEQLLKLRSEINESIQKIKNLRMYYPNEDFYDCKYQILEILKEI